MTAETATTRQGARCAALLGPYASGKTTLFEEILFATGAIDRRGSVRDGTTTGDSAPEARARGMSTELSVAATDYLGERWGFIDCPGSVELAQEAQAAMMVADVVVVVCEPLPEKAAAVSRLLRFLDSRAIPHVIFVNKMDQPEASVRATLHALQACSARPLVLREIPIRDGAGRITGMVDLVSERAWRWNPHKPSDLVGLPEGLRADETAARGEMLERLADFDDALMEELLEDIVPSTDEIYANLARDLARDLVVPVFFGSAENGNGINRLLKALRHEAPGPDDTAARLGVGAGQDGGPVAQVFKTLWAGQSGKLSVVRVWQGRLAEGAVLGSDRVGGLQALTGRRMAARGPAGPGEIVALGRMAHAATGDLLTSAGTLAADWPAPPEPLFALAIRAERQADEVKLGAALARLIEEDPSLSLRQNPATGELILAGQGEVHLQIALSRLAAEQKLSVLHAPPQVGYRETISRPGVQAARHRKQSGGHGEFADVTLEIAPLPRGTGFRFDDRITGGVVPKPYVAAVEKGVRGWLERGPLGFPVVDLAVTLTDGGHHPVDSSDMAFQKAAARAMTEAMPDCGPVLLEPVLRVAIGVPQDFTPRMQRIVTGRRGQLLGFDLRPGWPGWDEVQALIPEAETADLIVEIRAQSLGAGDFTAAFDHLQDVPAREAERIAARRAAG